ncbi:UNKNOWN [Stylonychia lemnae]|uniref:Uncharacterized protein n=1 Tax=Stylonychia lemnae TaxID=5949 RepID=A0A077ZY56_STYLE|nr:UNKNOWN [Stylonychia lemnae]|eukprot:CDW74810.1 UNKNOWN [Stylonychia lemnae]
MKFNESDFLVLKLYKKDDIYRLVITQRIKKLVSTDFINKDSTSSLKIRLTSEGDVYQILIDRITTWQQYYVSFYKNEQEIEYIGKKIERILENNFDNLEEQKQKIKAKHLKQKLNKIFADLTSKAQSLIQEIDHDFIIVGRKYLVYQNKINIFYILLDDITENKDFEKININLRKGKISQLAEVQNRSQVQFVYHQSKPFKYNYIVTWDLDKNIEVQILELPYQKGLREDIRIYKGVSERLNYYIPQDKNFIYDIRFEYPCNMYQGELIQDHIISNQFDVMAQNNYRNEKNIEENTQVGIPILRHLNFSLDGNNFYHYLFNNFTFLKQSLREIKRQTSELNNEEAEYYIYYLLFMNNKDESPFDLSMKNFTPRSIDILLDILSINDNYDYFIFLKKHLFRLLEMKSDKFERFFDECSSVKSHNIRVPWKIQRDLAYFTHNTSYISDEFIIEKLKVKREDLNETEDGPNTKVLDKILLNQYDLVPDIDEIQGLRYQIEPGFNTRDLYMNTDKKSVVFETYDFGWILKDDTGQQFIQYLKNQRIDSALFTLKIVQTIINTQWKILRHKVVLYEFIPMCIQIILVLLYNTNLNRNLFTYHTFQKYSEQEEMVYQIIHYVIGALQTILAIYFVILEFNKYKRSKSRTVLGFLIYHISVIIATMLDIGLIGIYEDNTIKDFLDNPLRDIFKILSSVIVFWSYLMFLLQLRIFEKYAALINVIFYVIKGSNLFFIIFFLTLFGFGNTYYILATLDQYETPDKKLTGSDILTAFVFAYRIVLVLAELEKLKKNEENEWTGMINSIEKKVRITIEKEQEKTVRVVQSLKNKLREVGNTISKQQEFQFEIKQNFDTVKFAIEQIATSISDLKKQQEKLEEKVDSIQIIALENQNSEINQDKIEHKPEEPPQKMKRQKQVVKQKRRKESFQEKKQDNEDDLPNQTASKRLTRSYTNVFYLKNQVKIS